MNLHSYFPILVLMVLSVTACNINPKAIEYGSDGCHYCSMTIVDRQHAAQIVTTKGKVFTFDAIECMMNHLKDIDAAEVALFLVNDYKRPGELIDARNATYLISEKIPSPMGEFLSAFQDKEEGEKIKLQHGGELYMWNELLNRFNK
ncbi:MAG: nitrous oxide reductase accessory protein NosL [Flavobacteriaceae bacterium]